MTYIDCVETAKIVRKCLKEAFPSVKFKVRSNVYAGGASIHVLCGDGPTETQVKGVIGHLDRAYFDGLIDYKGSIYHMLDGKQVSLGADFIFIYQNGRTFDVRVLPSPTATRYMVIGDDGYSRACGGGMSAANLVAGA